jgi:hypothetical protein
LPRGLQSLGFLGKTCQSGQRRPEQTEQRTKQYQQWPATGTFWDLIKDTQHPQALYLSPDREVSFTPHHVGWHLTVRVFLIGITRESCLKHPDQDLPGGHWPLSGPMERHLPLLASPMSSDLGFTHFLTWHCGVIETPTDGVDAYNAPHSDNPD